MVLEQDLPPSKDQLAELRQSLLAAAKETGKEHFDEEDLARFESDDSYAERFWIHGFFIPGADRVGNTTGLAAGALRWRKDFGARQITEDSLDRTLLESGSLYSKGRDRQGGRLLTLAVRRWARAGRPVTLPRYVKDPKMTPRRKQLFVYMLERIERETGGKITIIFDCQSAGIRNIELEAIQFIMQVLIHYYPNLVRRIIVLEMPWVMNAMWRLVKSLLPGPAQEMIKFCSKANITEYVEVAGLPRELGGEEEWEPRWEPERRPPVEEEAGEGRAWAVTPGERLLFRPVGEAGELEAVLTVSNRCGGTLAFKIRSTRPALFMVSPHSGLLTAGQEAEVRVRAPGPGGQARIERERFQVALVTEVRQGEDTRAVFADQGRASEVVVLGCEVERVRRVSNLETAGVEQANRQARVLSRKLGEMEDRMGHLRILLLAQCCLLAAAIAFFCMSRGLGRHS